MKLNKNNNGWCGRNAGDAVYGFGLLGALLYFAQHAPTLTDKLLVIFKALIWPAMLVYYVLASLKV